MPENNKSNNLKRNRQLQRVASYASLLVALVLIVAKLWSYMATNSVSILSSLVDSVLDMLASTITVVAVYYSLRPADHDHRFGHGKAEGLAALLQSIIVIISAAYVLKEAADRIINPQTITSPLIGLGVMGLSITLTIVLVAFQRYVVRTTGSLAIAADSLHYRADLLVNLGIAATIAIASWTSWKLLDPLTGCIIAAYIVWSAYGIASGALDVLLDKELSVEDRERIRAIAEQHPAVRGFHDLRTRSGGTIQFIQFHLELGPQTTLLESHRILDEVEDQIHAVYPRCEIIIHADPLGFEEMRDGFD
jgi:ferrous-iron efflux pump FieF